MKIPGANEFADIGGRDLGERRKPLSPAIAAPMFPGQRRGGQQQDDGKQAWQYSHETRQFRGASEGR